MKVLPVFLNQLTNRRCVVFGGNHEAERKVRELLDCDAAVSVISPVISKELQQWARSGRITWFRREYVPGDLKGAFLAIVAVIDPEKTRPIWLESQAERVLINAMDDIPHCTFVSGSVVRRGPIVISVSSSGCAPTLAVRLRQQIEEQVTVAHGTLAEWMGALRDRLHQEVPDFHQRRQLWYDIVDSDLLELIQSGRLQEATDLLEQFVVRSEQTAVSVS